MAKLFAQDRPFKGADHMLLANYLLKRCGRTLYTVIPFVRRQIFTHPSIPSELRGFLINKQGSRSYPDSVLCGCASKPAALQPLRLQVPQPQPQPLALQLVRCELQQHALHLLSSLSLSSSLTGSLCSAALAAFAAQRIAASSSVCCATELIGEAGRRTDEASADPYRMGGTCRRGQDASGTVACVVQNVSAGAANGALYVLWMNTLCRTPYIGPVSDQSRGVFMSTCSIKTIS